MRSPTSTRAPWGVRVRRTLSRWWGPTRTHSTAGGKGLLPLPLPRCWKCGEPAVEIELTESPDGRHLRYVGTAGCGNCSGDPISAGRAQAIRDAFNPPYESAKIRAAGFYDDCGFCSPCGRFYCPTHWQVSATGGGTCPAGHFKSLDPHWHPDRDEL